MEEADEVVLEVTVVTEGAEISIAAAEIGLQDGDHAQDLLTEGADKKTVTGRVLSAITVTSPGEQNVTGVRPPNLAVVEVVEATEETGEVMIEVDMIGGIETGGMTGGMIVEGTGGTTGAVVGMTEGAVTEDVVVAVVAAMCGMAIGPVPNVALTTSPVGQNALNVMLLNRLRVLDAMHSNEHNTYKDMPFQTNAVSGWHGSLYLDVLSVHAYCFYEPC